MTVKVTKPAVNLREKLAELDKPMGVAGAALMRADTPQEQQALLGVGRKNLIINGGFDVWQRSEDTGTVNSSVGYRSADRWITHGSGGTYRHTRQAIPMGDESLVGGCTSFSRFYTSVGNNNCGLGYKIEGVRSIPSSGQFTLSFYAKGTNPVGGNYSVEMYGVYGTANDDTVYSFSVTSEWQRITITDSFFAYADKTLSGTDLIELWWRQPNGDSSTAAWTLDITGVQLELGSVATPFEHRSYGEELALCQRYYYQLGGSASKTIAHVYPPSTSELAFDVRFPVTMRVVPSVSFSSTSSLAYRYAGNALQIFSRTSGSFHTLQLTPNGGSPWFTGWSHGQEKPGEVRVASGTCFLEFDAEL